MDKQLAYEQAFTAFLACTDEKDALRDWLLEKLQLRQVRSLLDIGPGTGELSLPLARVVERYLAIEPITKYAKQLRGQGLEVVEQTFPTKINEQFDIVLASHVINLTDTYVSQFVRAAWRLVNPDGALLIVTHQGIESDWLTMTKTLEEDNIPYHQAVFARLEQLLQVLGTVSIERLTTTITSQDTTQMLAALGFVWSDGDRQRWQVFNRHAEAIHSLLQAEFYHQDRYSMSFEHALLTVTRS